MDSTSDRTASQEIGRKRSGSYAIQQVRKHRSSYSLGDREFFISVCWWCYFNKSNFLHRYTSKQIGNTNCCTYIVMYLGILPTWTTKLRMASDLRLTPMTLLLSFFDLSASVNATMLLHLHPSMSSWGNVSPSVIMQRNTCCYPCQHACSSGFGITTIIIIIVWDVFNARQSLALTIVQRKTNSQLAS